MAPRRRLTLTLTLTLALTLTLTLTLTLPLPLTPTLHQVHLGDKGPFSTTLSAKMLKKPLQKARPVSK